MAEQRKIAPETGARRSLSRTDTGQNTDTLLLDHLLRLADLVAGGEITFASASRDLSPEDLHELEMAVRQLQHARLVRFIARQIAWDIHSTQVTPKNSGAQMPT